MGRKKKREQLAHNLREMAKFVEKKPEKKAKYGATVEITKLIERTTGTTLVEVELTPPGLETYTIDYVELWTDNGGVPGDWVGWLYFTGLGSGPDPKPEIWVATADEIVDDHPRKNPSDPQPTYHVVCFATIMDQTSGDKAVS